jgi:O-antigen/teichoic acid export membrane protein
MLVFGAGSLGVSVLGTFIVHGEKFLLVRFSSVESLAYYNVAATLAGLLAQVPNALSQPLMPSFVHLQQRGETATLARLFQGAVKTMLLWVLPAGFALCVCAPTLIRLWAGGTYVERSLGPLCILVLGWVFGGVLYVPKSLLSAWGKPGLIAWYQSAQLLPYVALMLVLITRFGLPGAALAWSLRSAFELWLLMRLVRRSGRLGPVLPRVVGPGFAGAAAALVLPVAAVRVFTDSQPLLIAALVPSLILYAAVAVRRLLSQEERAWLSGLLANLHR